MMMMWNAVIFMRKCNSTGQRQKRSNPTQVSLPQQQRSCCFALERKSIFYSSFSNNFETAATVTIVVIHV